MLNVEVEWLNENKTFNIQTFNIHILVSYAFNYEDLTP